MSDEQTKGRRSCSHFAQVLQIILDLTNLAEQLVVYFILKDLNPTELEERKFFFIILGIGFGSCLVSGITKPFLATVLSILIEIGELLAYIFVLPRSITMIVVVSVLSGVEIFLHVIMTTIDRCTEVETTEVASKNSTESCLSITYHLIFYVIYNFLSLLYLFLTKDSLFRETFYEILILLDACLSGFAVGIYGELFKARWKHRGWRLLLSCSVKLVWYIILRITTTIIFGLLIPISGLTLAVLEIKKRVDNKQLEMDYDFIIYMLSVFFFALMFLSNWLILYHVCFGIRNHFCVKVDSSLLKEPPLTTANKAV